LHADHLQNRHRQKKGSAYCYYYRFLFVRNIINSTAMLQLKSKQYYYPAKQAGYFFALQPAALKNKDEAKQLTHKKYY